MDLVNVDDFETAARERLDPGPYGYYAGGSGDEQTLRANAAAFARWELRPRVLVDVDEVSTATTVLGTELATPLLVAPTAFQRLAHPDGELAMARAAAAAGTVMCLSTLSSVTPAELAAAAPGAPQWFQLYWSRDRGFTQELLAAVVEAGFRALVLTVDFPVAGRRERDIREDFTLPDDLASPNLPGTLARRDFHAALGGIVDARLTWRDLEWLRSTCELPLVLKGVLTAEDTLLAAEHGAAALGARAAMTGRAALWGLAVDGEQGAARVLALLREEIEVGLKLLGARTPAEVTRAHVRPAGPSV